MLLPRPKGSAMPAERLPMRQVREVLRLKYLCGQSGHRIAAAIGISRYAVAEYLRRAAVVGITWPVPPDLDDTALERKLFMPPGARVAEALRPQPDWVRIHAEMRRAGVTLLLLWEEYRAGQPEGYGYSRFCDLYAAWRGRLSPTMRQSHPLGERLFVDYAGQTVEVVDALTGEGSAGADLCRRTGRLQPDVCRGSLDAGAGGLAGLPCQRLRLLRRR